VARRFVAQVRRNWFVPSAAMTSEAVSSCNSTFTRTARSRTSPSRVPPTSVPSTAPQITRSSGRIRPSRFRLSTPSRSRSSRSRSITTNSLLCGDADIPDSTSRASASEQSQRTFITMKVRSSYCSASRIQFFISAKSAR
jgi:hypothetical protein